MIISTILTLRWGKDYDAGLKSDKVYSDLNVYQNHNLTLTLIKILLLPKPNNTQDSAFMFPITT